MGPFIAVISHDNPARLLNNNIALQNIKIVLFQEPSKTVTAAATGVQGWESFNLGWVMTGGRLIFLSDSTDCKRFIE